jgi:hypothetical protein
MTTTPAVCAYCGDKAIHMDHVVPKSLQRKYHQQHGKKLPLDLAATVPSCGDCNWRKGTRRLVPPSWADKVDELNVLFFGSRFRVWAGDPQSEAFTGTYR